MDNIENYQIGSYLKYNCNGIIVTTKIIDADTTSFTICYHNTITKVYDIDNFQPFVLNNVFIETIGFKEVVDFTKYPTLKGKYPKVWVYPINDENEILLAHDNANFQYLYPMDNGQYGNNFTIHVLHELQCHVRNIQKIDLSFPYLDKIIQNQ